MRTVTGAALLVLTLQGTTAGQGASTVVDEALRAMGAEGLNSITCVGTAAIGNFGQSRTISFGVASATIRNYTVTIDFTRGALRATGFIPPPPVFGLPEPGDFEQVVTAGDPWSSQLDVWVTPWGFLRGAASAKGASMRQQKIDGTTFKVITWNPPLKAPSGQPYKLIGYINPDNLVERVETWVDHPVLGDLPIVRKYRDYRDFGGLKVPSRMSEDRLGMEVSVAAFAAAQANPVDLAARMTPSPRFTASTARAADAPRASRSSGEAIGDGVYGLPGEYAALAVALGDYAVVLGGGESEGRGQAIIAETKRLIPGKSIKYVVSTHPHFDHAAVLPPFVAEGVTILLDDVSRYFVEQALSSPRTLVGDALAKSKKKPKVEGIVEKMVLGDRGRTLELHHLERFDHSDAMLVAYLPQAKMLFADIEIPAPGAPPNPSIASLVQNLDRLQIDFDRLITVRPTEGERPLRKTDLVALIPR